MTDLQKLIAVLSEARVDFIIAGGVAATAHGSARLTEDLDIIYQRSDGNLHRLVVALAPYGPYLRGAPAGLPFVWDEQTLRRGLNFTLTTTLGALDLLGEIAGGGDYDVLQPGTIPLVLFGYECRCLSLDQLISAKRAAGRPKDLETLAELEAISEERQSHNEQE
jgi:hypothetical protein